MKNTTLNPNPHPLKTVLFTLLMTVATTTTHAQNWFETKKIVASDRAAWDRFGSLVSISGNYAIVGVPYEDEDAAGGNTQLSAGSTYIFEKDSLVLWTDNKTNE